MEEELIALYQDTRRYAKNFHKRTYASHIEELQEKYAGLFEELRMYLDSPEAVTERFSRCIVDHVQESMEKIEPKRKRDMEILEYNMAMVSYFLPLIRNVKSPRADELAQEMTDLYNQTFTDMKIGCPTIEQIKGGFKTGFCYVTTAVCKSLRKPDDCRELTLLREYRDGYMMQTEEGRSFVKEYYNIAPTIVKRIDRLADSAEIYRRIWEEYLSPCIRLIEEDRLEDCETVYVDMIRDLEKRYLYR